MFVKSSLDHRIYFLAISPTFLCSNVVAATAVFVSTARKVVGHV